MHKKTYLLPVTIFVIILLLASLACSLPFSGGDDSDDGSAGSSVEFEGGNDSDSDGDNDMDDSDSDGGNEMDDSDADSDHENGDSDSGSGESGGGPDAPFPLTDDADILLQDANSATYGTKLSIAESIDFYRAEFAKLGFTERDLLTVIADDSFSMVFDGHSSGQAILVQGTDFGESTNISIQFQDI